ncbi:LPP20 family lipoprotein [Aliivibrio kagoshimensis]|jgi:hypothetical protein|uniref:LPP20 family lipoprotein n=1 Tax=Aliivibrio kagoshimensis TaxID=2910230 RepID=UPI003D100E63
MRNWFIIITLLLTGCVPFSEMREQNVIHAVGYASINDQMGRSKEEKSIKAMRASKIDAYRELTEQVYGMRISGQIQTRNQKLGVENTSGAVDGIIRAAKVVKSYPIGDSYVTEMSLDLDKMEEMKQHGEVHSVPSTQKRTTLF